MDRGRRASHPERAARRRAGGGAPTGARGGSAGPYQALIGLRLRTLDGRLPPLGTALLREGYAWVLGMGFGLTLILPVTHAFSYYRITRYGTTPWDEKLGVRMEMHTLGTVRSIVVLLLVAVGTLGVVTGIQMMMNP